MAHPLFAPKKSSSPSGLEGHTIVGFGELMPIASRGPTVTLVILTQKFKSSGVFDYFVTLIVPVLTRLSGEWEVDHNIFHAPTLERAIYLAHQNECLPFPESQDYNYSPLLPTI
jgi:hypothetical protein